MKCRECNADMFLDDKDFNFEGNYDNYWLCLKCSASCVEKVRYGQCYRQDWYIENETTFKEYTLKFPIAVKINGRETGRIIR